VKAVQDGVSVKVAQVGGRPIGVETAAFEVVEEEDIAAPAVELEITVFPTDIQTQPAPWLTSAVQVYASKINPVVSSRLSCGTSTRPVANIAKASLLPRVRTELYRIMICI